VDSAENRNEGSERKDGKEIKKKIRGKKSGNCLCPETLLWLALDKTSGKRKRTKKGGETKKGTGVQ